MGWCERWGGGVLEVGKGVGVHGERRVRWVEQEDERCWEV